MKQLYNKGNEINVINQYADKIEQKKAYSQSMLNRIQ